MKILINSITMLIIFLSFISGKNINTNNTNKQISGTWEIELVKTYYDTSLINSKTPEYKSFIQIFDNKKLNFVSLKDDGYIIDTQFNLSYSYFQNKFKTVNFPISQTLDYLLEGTFIRLNSNQLILKTQTDNNLNIEYVLKRSNKNLNLYGI